MSLIPLAPFLLLPLIALNAAASPAETSQSNQAPAIAAIVQKGMKTEHLRAVIVKVTQGDKVVINQAFGESMTGVPATTPMHFRNGPVPFSYLPPLPIPSFDDTTSNLDH